MFQKKMDTPWSIHAAGQHEWGLSVVITDVKSKSLCGRGRRQHAFLCIATEDCEAIVCAVVDAVVKSSGTSSCTMVVIGLVL